MLTIACIESVYKTYRAFFAKGEFELLIVDNFSEDDSVGILEKEIREESYKHVHVLSHKENNGFGGGNNFGAAHAKGDYLLFLNNDTVVGKGLESMVRYLQEHQEIGVLGGVLKNPNGTMQNSFGTFYSLSQVLLLLLGRERLESAKTTEQKPQQVDWVKGACFMMTKVLFEKLKGFDEKIFMYTEDMELCYRVHLMGKTNWTFPEIEIIHKDQGSSSRSFAIVHIYEGILYFYQKHRSRPEQVLVKLLLQTKARILVLLGKLIKNEYLSSTYEKALNVVR
jgi:GT2 family glycosyltransferase